MSTKTTAAQLLAQFRAAAPIQSTATRTNTKEPIGMDDVATVRAYLHAHQPEWLQVWYAISVSTGWRTGDVINLDYKSINWAEGSVTITIAKQSKAYAARAFNAGLKQIRSNRQAEAMASGDGAMYLHWAKADADQVAQSATPDELDRWQTLVASAKRKTDTKPLSPELIERLKKMREQNFMDDYIFSRYQTASNSSRMLGGAPISRQSVWARMKSVFAALTDQIENAAKLSAYSTRKAFALALYHATGRVGAVTEALNHASEQVTMRYLCLARDVEQALARLAGRVTA